MTYIVTEPCIGTKDRSCIDVCPTDCFYDLGEHLIINPGDCIDCTECVEACPVDAIFAERDVPIDMQKYIPINIDPFKKQEDKWPEKAEIREESS